MEKHNTRAHALLSASKADRWINCTPSARLEDNIEDPPQSDYAAEGTLAHELAQLYLTADSLEEEAFSSALDDITNHKLFSEEMFEEVPKYVDYCEDILATALIDTTDAFMDIEQRIDFSRYVPEGFGTADCVVIADDLMEVIDLKYGKGVLVSAENNSQMLLYALGAYDKYSLLYDIKRIKMTIVQPRRDNISSWVISTKNLHEWVEKVLVKSAQLAWAGEGIQVTGDWCKFCKVKAQCKALTQQNLELTKAEFAVDPYLLTDDEIADALTKIPQLTEWANAIQSYAFTEALSGRKSWPGFKLVEGVARRKWANEKDAIKVLENETKLTYDEIYTTKLNSLTNIEKALGKAEFAKVTKNVIIKPPGAPTLVPISDKRPAIGLEQAKLDFQ